MSTQLGKSLGEPDPRWRQRLGTIPDSTGTGNSQAGSGERAGLASRAWDIASREYISAVAAARTLQGELLRYFAELWPHDLPFNLFTSDSRCDFIFRGLEQIPSRHPCEQIERPRDGSCPSRLVARPKASSVVTVEILVEQNVILPVRVFLKL